MIRKKVSEKTSSDRRFWLAVDKNTENGCWLWTSPSKDSGGYGRIYDSELGKVISAHRFSYMLHKGPIQAGYEIMHTCDNPSCVNPEHLRQGTHAENMLDMTIKGRAKSLRGSNFPKAKFTNDQVKAIREAYQNGISSQPELAKQYGVSRRLICHLVNGRSYKDC